MPQTSGRGRYLGPPKKKPKGQGGKKKKPYTGPPREQQQLASAVRAAALKSGMSWAEWMDKRKTLVKSYRLKGTTAESKKAVREAVSLIKKANKGDPNIAKVYKRKAKALDRKGPKEPSPKGTQARSSGGKVKKKKPRKSKQGGSY